MLNSNEPIKVTHIQKLGNQSIHNQYQHIKTLVVR